MQIRLTVLGPRSGGPASDAAPAWEPGGGGTAEAPASADVLVTAPGGTALGAVAGALAGALGLRSGARGGRSATHVHLYAGSRRLDEQALLGVPPLVDGAVLSIDAPGPAPAVHDHGGPEAASPGSAAELHVAGGPDAGGVHLLHPGTVTVGRSADADVPLDDPDVSRLHLVLTVSADGRAAVADRGSTNGTALDGVPVGAEPRALPAGALLRVGESTLQLLPPAAPGERPGGGTAAVPDGQGHLEVPVRWAAGVQAAPGGPHGGTASAAGTAWPWPSPPGPAAGGDGAAPIGRPVQVAAGPSVPGPVPGGPGTGAGGHGVPPAGTGRPDHRVDLPAQGRRAPSGSAGSAGGTGAPGWTEARGDGGARGGPAGRTAPTHLGTGPESPRARARDLLTRGREKLAGRGSTRNPDGPARPFPAAAADAGPGTAPDAELLAAARRRWPDPAALLAAALGAGPRLWERGPDHPDALAIRLGTSDGSVPGRPAGAPAVVDLRAVGSLGLVGRRPRLSGLARSAAAQLAVLHGPSALELVLVSADPARPPEDRLREWSWLFWLPQLRPARDQQCRLLTGLDPEQAAARLAELAARADGGGADSTGPGRPPGAATVLLLDGDPGSAEGREAVRQLLARGPSAGIHPVCLAERRDGLPPGTGAVASIGGEIATLLRIEYGGAFASRASEDGIVLDAVSAEWAEHLARALAPLRERQAALRGRGPLPESPRLLDLLGLEMVTPAKLSARWDSLPTTADAVRAVLGATRDGACAVDLADASGSPDGSPHLLIGGGPGSGKTELLRTLIASLAVAERPDRLEVLAVVGRTAADPAQTLAACGDLPHVTAVVDTADPVRTLQAAEALAEELARRERALRGRGYASWYAEHTLNRMRLDLLGAQRPEARVAARFEPVAAPGPDQRHPDDRAAGGSAGAPALPGGAGPRPGEPPLGAGGPHRGPLPPDRPRPPAPPVPGRPAVPGQVQRGVPGPAGTPAAAGGATAAEDASRAAEAASAVPPPRLLIAVDDVDALLDPAGGPGADSPPLASARAALLRVLERVAAHGARLGVHLAASTGRPERTSGSAMDEAAELRIALRTDDPAASQLLIHVDEAAGLSEEHPGRGYLRHPDGGVTAFQGARISGRIPRTATLRPTVVALEWAEMGSPPTRRPVRELGNGPTDLALLGSALQRAAASLDAAPVPPLL